MESKWTGKKEFLRPQCKIAVKNYTEQKGPYHMLSVVPNRKARAELAMQMHWCHFCLFSWIAGRQAGLLSPHLIFRFLQTHRRHCKSWKLEKIKLKWFVNFGLIKAQSPTYLPILTYLINDFAGLIIFGKISTLLANNYFSISICFFLYVSILLLDLHVY